MYRKLIILVAVVGLWLGLGAQAQAQTQPEAYWVGPPTVEVDEGAGSLLLQIGLSGVSSGSQFVVFSVQPGGTATEIADFDGGAGFRTWVFGDTTPQFVWLTIVDDALVEPTETLFLVISDADGPLISPTDNVVQINIVDNDGPGGLPRATITDLLGNQGDIGQIFCPDNQGQLLTCGTTMTFQFPWQEVGEFRVVLDTAPAAGDTVRIGLESWGAVTLPTSVVKIANSTSASVPFTVATGGWSALGGVRLVAPGVIAPPSAGEYHEARILVDEALPWDSGFCAACLLWTYLLADHNQPCVDLLCQLTVGCGGGLASKGASATGVDLDLLRRYRDEVLATSSEGQAVTGLYGAMGLGVVQAFLSDPGLGADFAAVRNGWFPALTNLLDGDGSMVVSALMQAQLTGLLDNLAAAAGSELAVQLADLRSSAGLDALVGMTIATANAQFTTGGATPIESTSWGNLKAQFR